MSQNLAMEENREDLHMVRAELDTRSLHRWMGARGITDYGHAMHCLITESMGRSAPRTFRAGIPARKSSGTLMGYTSAPAGKLREEFQACADPLQHRIIVPDSIDTKQMPRRWEPGRVLGFEVRTRPVVRLERDLSRVNPDIMPGFLDGTLRPGQEQDVYVWEKVRRQTRGEEIQPREEVYAGWLTGKLRKQGGCDPHQEAMVVADYRRDRVSCRNGLPGILGPETVIRGLLTIADPELFSQLLRNGIGRYRAYGFGMVLVKPALPPRRLRRPEKVDQGS